MPATLLERGDIGIAEVRARVLQIQQSNADVLRAFHRLFYDEGCVTWRRTSWRMTPCLKAPTDLFVYQDLIAQIRPDLIIETGTAFGGSALFFADLQSLYTAHGTVLTIELLRTYAKPTHDRIEALKGNSVGRTAVQRARHLARQADRVMVVLDSSHDPAHVAHELAIYSELVTPGSFLVVEDTNLNHEVRQQCGDVPGPLEAVTAFLARDRRFRWEPACERYLLTFNPGGWLMRLPQPAD